MIAVASATFAVFVATLAAGQTVPSDQAVQIRDYLKLPKHQGAVVVFMDFQCPSCQKTWPKLKEVLDRHPETKFYAVDFPLTHLHKNAFDAAVAYEIAKGAGAQRSTYDDLLSGKQSLSQPDLNAYLKAHKLPGVVGTAKAGVYEAKVNDQLRFALSLKINKTPTILVVGENGTLTELRDPSKLEGYLR